MPSTSLALCSLLLLTSATPLAIRGDVDEAAHLELGAQFPAVVQVSGLGSGVLVAPDWVLTAAHVPEMVRAMMGEEALAVELGGERYSVAEVVIAEQREVDPEGHDIALLRLERAAPDSIAPLELAERDVRAGDEFVLAGFGILARGDEGVVLGPEAMAAPTRRLRAGRNAVERVDAEASLFYATFDDGDSALPLEAGPCIGDSGGPALVRVGAGEEVAWRVAGVIALVDDTDEDRILGEYGEEFGMTLAAAYADWIRTTIGD